MAEKKIMGWMWLIILVLIVVAVIVKIRRNMRIFIHRQQNPFTQTPDDFFGRTSESAFRQRTATTARRYSSGKVEKMIGCAYCEIYVPESEVIVRAGKNFCCHEHAIAYFSKK